MGEWKSLWTSRFIPTLREIVLSALSMAFVTPVRARGKLQFPKLWVLHGFTAA